MRPVRAQGHDHRPLRGTNESKVDEATRTALIQPVISNRELARRLGEHNLAFPIGHCPTVKAGGYLLNGGMSWNMGHWGTRLLERRGGGIRHCGRQADQGQRD